MDEDQTAAYNLIISGHNTLLTGQGGTGKSYVIKKAVHFLRKEGYNVALTCSTGIAASHFDAHASTLHKWAGLEDGRYENMELLNLLKTGERFQNVNQNLKLTNYLFIDEISMISSKLLSQVEFVCSELRDQNLYFGGISVILSGDFFQLPPVKNQLYGDFGRLCFSLPWFKCAFPHHIDLKIIHRQSESLLIQAVNDLEQGKLSEKTVAFVNSLNRPLKNLFLEKAIYLFARNIEVDFFNYEKIQSIQSQLYVFQSEDEGSNDFLQKILAPKYLGLKIGVPVMLLVNLTNELVNGKIGKVFEIENDNIYVEFKVGEVRKTVQIVRQLFTKYDSVDNIYLAKRLQFPLKLAYAITIHKSQGMSLDAVVVDCSNAGFPGQIGVAVGREKCSDGLVIKNFKPSLVKPHSEAVYKLYENCSIGEVVNDFSCCKMLSKDTDENNNSDNSSFNNEQKSEDSSDDDTLNYYEEKNSGSEFSDLEPDVLELIDEMEMPDNLLDTFKSLLSEFSDTPLYDSSVKMKTETLEHLLSFTQWYDGQQNKIHDFANAAFEEGKTQFSTKNFNKFYTNISQYLQSKEFRSETSKLADIYKYVDKHEVFQILTTITFNLQNQELKVVNERCEKDKPDILKKISTEQDLIASARGKIRYISGYVVAKLKYKNSKLLRNSLFAPGKEERVKRAMKKNELLDLCISYADIAEISEDPESLLETKRKQNKSEGLCNVSDQCFAFFHCLEKNCRQLLTYESLYENRQDMYTCVENTLLSNATHIKSSLKLFESFFMEEHGLMECDFDSIDLCISNCTLCDIIQVIFKDCVCLFLKVSMAQFRKDFLSALKTEKTKALRKKVVEKMTMKTKDKQLDMNFIKTDKSETKLASHLRLKSDLIMENVSLDKHFKKSELVLLCSAYDIKLKKTIKKCDFTKQLLNKVVLCDRMPYPERLSQERMTETSVQKSDAQSSTVQGPSSKEHAMPGPMSEIPTIVGPASEVPAIPGPSTSVQGTTEQHTSDIESDTELNAEGKKPSKGKTAGTCRGISTKGSGKQKKLTTRKGKSKLNKGKGKGKGKRTQQESNDENCAICYKTYKDSEDWICCDNCTLWYHRYCAGLENVSLWEKYTVHDDEYLCPLCQ